MGFKSGFVTACFDRIRNKACGAIEKHRLTKDIQTALDIAKSHKEAIDILCLCFGLPDMEKLQPRLEAFDQSYERVKELLEQCKAAGIDTNQFDFGNLYIPGYADNGDKFYGPNSELIHSAYYAFQRAYVESGKTEKEEAKKLFEECGRKGVDFSVFGSYNLKAVGFDVGSYRKTDQHFEQIIG